MKTLIFDFDGTIADSFETLLDIFEEITARPRRLTPKEIEDLRGKSLKEIIKYLRIRRWQIPRLVLQAKRHVSLRITGIKAFKGLPGALKQLHKSGYQMFILSTNSSDNIAKFLKTNSLDGYFVGIYGDIGLRSKSSALKKIIKKEKLSASQCLYIGDEVRDIEAAKKVGMKPIAVSWGFNYPQVLKDARPEFLAVSPGGLKKYLTS